MKKILLFFVLTVVIFSANAQKIHWLLFIDTDDYNVGSVDKKARYAIKDHLVNVVNSVLTQEGYEPKLSDNYGNMVSSQNCKNIVNNLQCGPNDIIVFYYIGHGGRNPNDAVRWPMMCMHEDVRIHPERMIPLEWVHNKLKTKNARLTITIGMCCNSEASIVPVRKSIGYGTNFGSTFLSESATSMIKNLFLKNRGDFMVTAAQPKQVATCGIDDKGEDKYPIDIFTLFLLYSFETNFSNPNITWEGWFDQVVSMVWNDSKNTQCPQRPFYESNLSSVSQPVIENNCRPMPSIVNVNDLTSLENMMEAIVCNQEDMPGRSRYFNSNCVVRILGQDGQTQVDQVSINTYMLRCRTSDALLRVVPIDVTTDGGKIKEFYVKEYYKKGGIR